MQFFRIANIGPGFVTDLGNCRRVQTANFRQDGIGEGAAHFHGPSATLFEWSIVEIGVRIGVENLV